MAEQQRLGPRYVVEQVHEGWQVFDLGKDRCGHEAVGDAFDEQDWADVQLWMEAVHGAKNLAWPADDSTEVEPSRHTGSHHRHRAVRNVLDTGNDGNSTILTVGIAPIASLQTLDLGRLCVRVDGDYENASQGFYTDGSYGVPGVMVSIVPGAIGEKEIQIFTDWKGRTSVRFWLFEDNEPEDLFEEQDEIKWARQRYGTGAGEFSYFDVLVALLGSGGAGAVLAAALGNFLLRHKQIEFHSSGELKSVHGYTASEFDRILKAIKLSGEMSEELFADPDVEIDDKTFEALMKKYDHLLLGDAESAEDDAEQGEDDV